MLGIFRKRNAPHLIGGNELYQMAGDGNAKLYAGVIGLGVPALSVIGWYFELDILWKIAIVGVFFSVAIAAYLITEVGWIVSEIRVKGRLLPEDVTYQRSDMQSLYWGAATAVVFWLIGWINLPLVGQLSEYLQYGPVEVFVILHTIVLARFSISVFYNLLDDYENAVSGQLRFDRADRPGG